jgi:hypothetical protein
MFLDNPSQIPFGSSGREMGITTAGSYASTCSTTWMNKTCHSSSPVAEDLATRWESVYLRRPGAVSAGLLQGINSQFN